MIELLMSKEYAVTKAFIIYVAVKEKLIKMSIAL